MDMELSVESPPLFHKRFLFVHKRSHRAAPDVHHSLFTISAQRVHHQSAQLVHHRLFTRVPFTVQRVKRSFSVSQALCSTYYVAPASHAVRLSAMADADDISWYVQFGSSLLASPLYSFGLYRGNRMLWRVAVPMVSYMC